MGWWWDQEKGRNSEPKPEITAQGPSENHIPPPISRDEQAFADLKELFANIDPEATATASTAARTAIENPAIIPDSQDSLYMSTMSCWQCWDLAYYCSSMGGQMNNVYRFGGLRSCNDAWAQWRFCMRTKAMSEDTRRAKIREWNQMREAKYKVSRSSEDIWNVRTEPVENPYGKGTDEFH